MTVDGFAIHFLESAPNDDEPHMADDEPVAYGEIQIGTFTERFLAPLSYWSTDAYARQWAEGLQRLVNQLSPSCLITSMYDPTYANFITLWNLYLDERTPTVYVQNQILFFDQLHEAFALNRLYHYIPERMSMNEDGHPISEWRTTRDAINAFLKTCS
jgi:hypothetical protein